MSTIETLGVPQVGPVFVDATSGQEDGLAALRAAAEATLEFDLDVALVGDADTINAALSDTPHDAERLRVVAAAPRDAIRIGLAHVATQEGASFVTAGDPALTVRTALAVLPLLDGVARPAMAAVVPTLQHRGDHDDPFALLLDVGATVKCSGEELAHFAYMGAAYAKRISRNERPVVALLSHTADRKAARTFVRDADTLLRAADAGFDYRGLILPERVPEGDADVVVADGYSGQLFVRTLEGVAATAEALLGKAQQRFSWRVGATLLGSGISRLRELTNWEHYGGAPMLGVDRTVILTQENAGQLALTNAIRLAAKVERLSVRDAIAGRIDPAAPIPPGVEA